jgi:hypothetical protein
VDVVTLFQLAFTRIAPSDGLIMAEAHLVKERHLFDTIVHLLRRLAAEGVLQISVVLFVGV